MDNIPEQGETAGLHGRRLGQKREISLKIEASEMILLLMATRALSEVLERNLESNPNAEDAPALRVLLEDNICLTRRLVEASDGLSSS
jgi:hypothetical protein